MSTNINADLPEYYVIVCFVEGDFKVILRLLSHFGIIFDVGLQPRFLLKTYDSMYFFQDESFLNVELQIPIMHYIFFFFLSVGTSFLEISPLVFCLWRLLYKFLQ